MQKKLLPVISVLLIAAFVLAACAAPPTPAVEAPAEPAASQDTEEPAAPEPPAGGQELYYLNFKPEVAEIYGKIAEAYKAETGNTLKVVTAAAGTYEQTLKIRNCQIRPPGSISDKWSNRLPGMERLHS